MQLFLVSKFLVKISPTDEKIKMEVKRGIEKGMKMKIKMKTNIMIKITKKRWMAKIIDKEG